MNWTGLGWAEILLNWTELYLSEMNWTEMKWTVFN